VLLGEVSPVGESIIHLFSLWWKALVDKVNLEPVVEQISKRMES